MSPRTARRILWLASLLMVPVPLLLLADAFVPTARLLELAGVVLITIFVEGPAGVSVQLLALFLAHVVIYAALLWVMCWFAVALLARCAPTALGIMTLAAVLVAFAWTSLYPVYDSAFHARTPHATLLEVYE